MPAHLSWLVTRLALLFAAGMAAIATSACACIECCIRVVAGSAVMVQRKVGRGPREPLYCIVVRWLRIVTHSMTNAPHIIRSPAMLIRSNVSQRSLSALESQTHNAQLIHLGNIARRVSCVAHPRRFCIFCNWAWVASFRCPLGFGHQYRLQGFA